MWFLQFIKSSIGKKMIMAATGLLLILFLFVHVLGNAAIYFSSKAFQTYADQLHSFPVVVFVFSSGLFAIILLHVYMGITLYLQNREEGKGRYAVPTRTVKHPLASDTMIYSGIYLLVFMLVHVSNFTFRDTAVPISVSVQELLGGFWYGSFYLISFGVLALHTSHGFWSMLQTFGINHPRYNTLIGRLTYIIPVFFLIMFGGIPLYFMTGLGANY